jgi:hypothetical protein
MFVKEGEQTAVLILDEMAVVVLGDCDREKRHIFHTMRFRTMAGSSNKKKQDPPPISSSGGATSMCSIVDCLLFISSNDGFAMDNNKNDSFEGDDFLDKAHGLSLQQ